MMIKRREREQFKVVSARAHGPAEGTDARETFALRVIVARGHLVSWERSSTTEEEEEANEGLIIHHPDRPTLGRELRLFL